jgi:syntaxin 5
MGRSVLMYDDSQKQTNSINGDGSTILNMDLLNKQQMQKSLMLNQEESFLRERTNAMQTVEQTIVELGGMFQQLATMIKEQDESIQRIDSNIDDVDMNVTEAHNELLKYFQSVTSNRWLMIKVFFVLITFFIVFVVVMT